MSNKSDCKNIKIMKEGNMVNLPSKLVRFLHSYTLQPLCLGFLQPIWKVASAWSHLGLSGKLWPNPICTHLWNSAPEPAWRQRETHFHQLPVPCCQVANASWSPRRRRSSRTLGRVQLLQLPGKRKPLKAGSGTQGDLRRSYHWW